MVGVVTSVRKGLSVEGVGRVYVISGAGIGLLLNEQSVIWDRSHLHPEWAVAAILGWQQQDIEEFKAVSSPWEAMQNRYEAWAGKEGEDGGLLGKLGTEYTFSDGKKATDLLVIKRAQDGGALSEMVYGNDLRWASNLFSYEGTFYNYFKSLISPPFNEMFVAYGDRTVHLFSDEALATTRLSETSKRAGTHSIFPPDGSDEYVDLERGKAYLVHRPVPFDDGNLGIEGLSYLRVKDIINRHELERSVIRQEFVVINDEDVAEKSLGLSSDQVYTVYRVSFGANSIIDPSKLELAPPEYDEGAIALYGYKPLKAQMEGIDFAALDANQVFAGPGYVSWLQKKLRSWYQWADKFMSGSLVLRGNPYIKPGKFLVFATEEDRFERRYFYIDTVGQDYTYGDGYQTTVSLARGTPTKRNPEGSNGEIFAPRISPAKIAARNPGNLADVGEERQKSRQESKQEDAVDYA
jgi:hypothetical protein